jgi:hypothetical protein
MMRKQKRMHIRARRTAHHARTHPWEPRTTLPSTAQLDVGPSQIMPSPQASLTTLYSTVTNRLSAALRWRSRRTTMPPPYTSHFSTLVPADVTSTAHWMLVVIYD